MSAIPCYRERRLLVATLVRDGEGVTALGATASQYTATVLSRHTSAEAMLVLALSARRLVSAFHVVGIIFIGTRFSKADAKVHILTEKTKP